MLGFIPRAETLVLNPLSKMKKESSHPLNHQKWFFSEIGWNSFSVSIEYVEPFSRDLAESWNRG
jgi:hypothetical protein